MTEAKYEDRQNLEMGHWPELRESWNDLLKLIFPTRETSGELKKLVFLMASVASGCRHCQSHGAYHLHMIGMSDEKIQAVWDFERSDLFTDAERAALSLALAAGSTPNATEPEHFVEMRKHFSDIQTIEILSVIAAGGYLNRWNDTIATVTDQESIDFANRVLQPIGWDAGKHVGEAKEQRPAHPVTLGWTKK